MDLRYKRAVDTRRIYLFEAVFTRHLPSYVWMERSIQFLRTTAMVVWMKHGRRGLNVPTIEFHRGLTRDGELYSYSDGFRYIALAPTQRNVMILLHELTHAMGYGSPHGDSFAHKYAELLVEYGGCDEGLLVLFLANVGIKI